MGAPIHSLGFLRVGCARGAARILAVLVTLLILSGSGKDARGEAVSDEPTAKYVFLFIGDGMGPSHRMAAEQLAGKPLAMNNLPVTGVTKTHSANSTITDSAAAITAMACGVKTDNGTIGQTPDGQRVRSVAELAHAKGTKVGIISSVSIDHATPAGFYAHVPSRNTYFEIGLTLPLSGFDYFAGGGFIDIDGRKAVAAGRVTKPEKTISDVARENGYRIVADAAEFRRLQRGDERIIAFNPRFADSRSIPYALDARDGDISLAEFTRKGIELLDNDRGFFMMVEGGKIDWASHANDAAPALREVIAMDEAVQVALAFAKEHKSETLIVTTADHETGGLTLGVPGQSEPNVGLLKLQKLSSHSFRGEVLSAWKAEHGPGTPLEAFLPLMAEYYGLCTEANASDAQILLSAVELAELTRAYDYSMGGIDANVQQEYGGREPLTCTLTSILNRKAGLGWTTLDHTPTPVITTALGAGAERFGGHYDNTAIATNLMRAMGMHAGVVYEQAGRIPAE